MHPFSVEDQEFLVVRTVVAQPGPLRLLFGDLRGHDGLEVAQFEEGPDLDRSSARARGSDHCGDV